MLKRSEASKHVTLLGLSFRHVKVLIRGMAHSSPWAR